MGYGEFDGGGSVTWKVKHNGGREKKDKDEDAPKDGQFTVLLRGHDPIFIPFDEQNDPEIRIIWTPDTLSRQSATSKRGRKATSRRKTGTSRKYTVKKS